MPGMTYELKEKLLHAVNELENEFSKVKFAIKKKLNVLKPVRIMPYHGFANDNYVYLKGRVLEIERITQPDEIEKLTEKWLNMWKRMESDEIPGAKLKAWFGDKELYLETDEEGYFDVEIHTDEKIDFNKTNQKIHLQLLDEYTDKDDKEAEGYLFVPGKQVDFGVISDMDDTVLVSHANEFMGNVRLMLQKSATERSPFPGIAGFLRALQKGHDGRGHNPIFFVSASEWNLYDLLISFLKAHDIPEGPLLLRDRGTALERGDFTLNKIAYKSEKIRHILDTYPELKFICIGDNGQQDPETYQKIVEEYPGRILGIYVRDVTLNHNRNERAIAEKVKEYGTEMVLAKETYSAAKHAQKMGWINENQLSDIEREREKDEQQE